MKRLLEPELLDELPADHPAAIRSRRDLRRVNWWMGNARWISQTIREQMTTPPSRILELGAGDGTLMLEVARRVAPHWNTPVELFLLDRQYLLSEKTRAAFHELGWKAKVIQMDLADWIQHPQPADCGLIVANLFLHHFVEDQLRSLFRAISSTAAAFIAMEPKRWGVSLASTRLLWLIGCNYVTRHDARVSVRAGFQGHELSPLWPDNPPWLLREMPAGLASHLFFAQPGKTAAEPQRTEAAPSQSHAA